MNDPKAMRTFIEVARNESFSASAKRLGMSTSSVSRLVMELEDWLGTPLLRRSPRRVALTDAGARFLDRCVEIVEAADDLRQEARDLTGRPRGSLKVAAAAYPMRKRFGPLIPAFLERYPDINLTFHLQNAPINLIAEGIDVAIRIGHLADSSMIARKCGETALMLTASPAFLAEHGVPSSLEAVPSFPCLSDLAPSYGRRWPIGRQININGPVSANDGDIIRQMTVAGLGLSLLPDFIVEDDLAEGRLTRLFADEIDEWLGIYLVYPAARRITSAVRVFVDFMAENLRTGRSL